MCVMVVVSFRVLGELGLIVFTASLVGVDGSEMVAQGARSAGRVCGRLCGIREGMGGVGVWFWCGGWREVAGGWE